MARPLAFDPAAALDRAVDLFWERGYAATTLDDLLTAMRISRASLYNTFGDKHALFLAALGRFRQREDEKTAAIFETHQGLPAIQHLLESAARTSVCDCRGCMVLKAGLERAHLDPAVAAFARESLASTTSILLRALEQAQAANQLAPSLHLRRAAHSLLATFIGLRALAATNPEPETVVHIVTAALESLGEKSCDFVLNQSV